MAMTLKKCHIVKPAEATPNIKMSLSESDQINALTHASTIYFYRSPTIDYPFASAVQTLKTSLSQLLVHFYPLAGRQHWINDGGHRIELECNSMGVKLYEAESEEVVGDYGDFTPTPELGKLIPSVDHNSTPIHDLPLLHVQLTKFRCGGMSLGVAFFHVMADGTEALNFIAEWARIARGLPLDCVPFLDRTSPWQVVSDQLRPRPTTTTPPKFDHPEFNFLPLLMGRSDDKEERAKESDIVILRLAKSEVEKIKRQANESNDRTDRPYSRYEAVTGHIWKCACKALKLDNQQITTVQVAVDARSRLDPPLPKGYFGNAVFPTQAISLAGVLMEKPLSYASSRIREAIEKMTNEYIRSSIDFLKTQDDLNKFRIFPSLGCTKGTFFGNPNLSVTSWTGLSLYGVDFGWGKEIHMGPGSLDFEGRCFILSGPDGDGSLRVALQFQVAHVDFFKKFFYEDII